MTSSAAPLRRTGLAALTAFGLGTVALVAPASAHPNRPTTHHEVAPSWWRPTPRPVVLTADQQRDYWLREGRAGVVGTLSYYEVSLLGQFGATFDRNRDGRLLGNERRGWDMLVASMRQYDPADSNGSGSLNRYEVKASAFFAPRVLVLDRTGDGRLDRQEVRDAMIESYRRGDTYFASSIDCHGDELNWTDAYVAPANDSRRENDWRSENDWRTDRTAYRQGRRGHARY